jgi:hypothetical protein
VDRPTVRPNSDIVAAHLRSATARLAARIENNFSASKISAYAAISIVRATVTRRVT